MVSFTSLIMVSLMATAQLVQSGVIDSLKECPETWALTTKNTLELDHLVVDDSAMLTKFIQNGKPNQSPTVVQIEKSPANINHITAIHTAGIFNNQYNIRIDFVKQDMSLESRFFTLTDNLNCRVKYSAKYKDIKAVTYVSRQHDEESK